MKGVTGRSDELKPGQAHFFPKGKTANTLNFIVKKINQGDNEVLLLKREKIKFTFTDRIQNIIQYIFCNWSANEKNGILLGVKNRCLLRAPS